MDSAPTAKQAYLARIEALLRQGRQHLRQLASGSNVSAVGHSRPWQQECASLVSDLSGGSKAHWLSRAHSDAFLVRATDGRAMEQAPIAEIMGRLVGVLEQAKLSLSQADRTPAGDPQPAARRFDFVHEAAIRPVLEAAYLDSRLALDGGRFSHALVTTCSLLEAIVTDALTHADRAVLIGHGSPEGPINRWSFEERLSVAERAGLIRGGCARLPAAARGYTDLTDDTGELVSEVQVSERDARTAGQVLNVIIRDLDPGR